MVTRRIPTRECKRAVRAVVWTLVLVACVSAFAASTRVASPKTSPRTSVKASENMLRPCDFLDTAQLRQLKDELALRELLTGGQPRGWGEVVLAFRRVSLDVTEVSVHLDAEGPATVVYIRLETGVFSRYQQFLGLAQVPRTLGRKLAMWWSSQVCDLRLGDYASRPTCEVVEELIFSGRDRCCGRVVRCADEEVQEGKLAIERAADLLTRLSIAPKESRRELEQELAHLLEELEE